MDEQDRVSEQPQELHVDVPPRLIYEAAFTARNAEGSILDSNTRYFYLGQVALIGYMIFETKSYWQAPTNILFLSVILMLCCFALSYHAVYTERRMTGSFRLMRISEDTCGYYETHANVDPALYFYGNPIVREREASRAFADEQVGLIARIANLWVFLAWLGAIGIVCMIVFKVTAYA